MLDQSTHIFWELMGVFLGIYLLVDGIYTLKKTNNKKLRAFAWFRIFFGILGIIIDGLIFLPSWS